MNRLSSEKSPYLLMHRDNPVDWYPWCAEAFEAARSQNRPILLSIGYSSCHWCHVIAHESFEDAKVAALLNERFVSIKVDREERPDVDAVYMDAVMLSTGSGGWPMTLLLTPNGLPFFAATYLSKEAMLRVLTEASALWREDRAALVEDAELLAGQMRALADRPVPERAPDAALTEFAAQAFANSCDRLWGGFGRAPKFPSAHNLLFLLAHHERTGDRNALMMAEGTLNAMARGGLFDHIGGGFCRYSVDRKWLVPHFEKMLYDNALLLWTYAVAWRITGKQLYRDVAERTANYVLREMTGPDGEFFCAQDADSEGKEGAFYVFTPDELRHPLGEEGARRFCAQYGVTTEGNFEGKNIPNLIGSDDWPDSDDWTQLRRLVYDYRRNRMALERDDKVLTAWNALMIAALCEASEALQRPDWLEAAVRAEHFLHDHLLDSGERPLLRWRDGEARGDGVLADCAFWALALVLLNDRTGQVEYLRRAEKLADQIESHFSAPGGGLCLYSDEGEPLPSRPRETWDAAMPSGNSAAALALWKLAERTGDSRRRTIAEAQLRFIAGCAGEAPTSCGFGLYAITQALK